MLKNRQAVSVTGLRNEQSVFVTGLRNRQSVSVTGLRYRQSSLRAKLDTETDCLFLRPVTETDCLFLKPVTDTDCLFSAAFSLIFFLAKSANLGGWGSQIEFLKLCMVFRKVISFMYKNFYLIDRIPLTLLIMGV